MTSQVVVSRIQNRRGTQTQFDGYPYSSLGPNSLYPVGYTGIGGYGSFPTFDAINYPSVLMPGELALCTDTRRLLMGNINGEYIEVTTDQPMYDIVLTPLVTQLPPSPLTYSTILPLTYSPRPFFTLLYSLVDVITTNPNQVGNSFSKMGELKISATVDFAPIPNPPFQPLLPVTLMDTGTEVNATAFDINFKTEYDLFGNIQIMYTHNFPTSLSFSTSSIIWADLP